MARATAGPYPSGMILVTGATGNIGSALVARLLESGAQVRALVRSAPKAPKGVEAAVGDFDKPATLEAAMKGVDKVFMLAAGAQEPATIAAAERAGVKHLVMLSSLGVVEMIASGPMHIGGEKALQASKLAWTILRPHEFMTNALQWVPTVRSQGVIYRASGSGGAPMIDPRDIADVAAKVLTSEGHESKIYALTGPEVLIGDDLARCLSDAIGKPVKFVDVPGSALRDQLASYRMPVPAVDAIVAFYDSVRAGKQAEVLPTLKSLTGSSRTFATWAKDNAAAFR